MQANKHGIQLKMQPKESYKYSDINYEPNNNNYVETSIQMQRCSNVNSYLHTYIHIMPAVGMRPDGENYLRQKVSL